jgi:hypothetical protein
VKVYRRSGEELRERRVKGFGEAGEPVQER